MNSSFRSAVKDLPLVAFQPIAHWCSSAQNRDCYQPSLAYLDPHEHISRTVDWREVLMSVVSTAGQCLVDPVSH